MSNKNGIIRIKVEYEETPIIDSKVHGKNELNNLLENIKKKLR